MACIGTPATVPSVRKVTSTLCAPSDFTTRYVVTLPFSSPNSSPIISDLLWIRFVRYVAETYLRRVDSSEAFRVNRNQLQLACLKTSRDDASQNFFVRWPNDNLYPTAPFRSGQALQPFWAAPSRNFAVSAFLYSPHSISSFFASSRGCLLLLLLHYREIDHNDLLIRHS